MTIKILTLTNNNKNRINNMIKTTKNNFIFFLADWCGHCKAFKPVHNELINYLKNNPNFANGNIIIVSDKTMRYLDVDKPNGFPTLRLFHNTTFIKDYNEPRELANILNFIKNNMGDFSPKKDGKIKRKRIKTKKIKLFKNKKSYTKKRKKKKPVKKKKQIFK